MKSHTETPSYPYEQIKTHSSSIPVLVETTIERPDSTLYSHSVEGLDDVKNEEEEFPKHDKEVLVKDPVEINQHTDYKHRNKTETGKLDRPALFEDTGELNGQTDAKYLQVETMSEEVKIVHVYVDTNTVKETSVEGIDSQDSVKENEIVCRQSTPTIADSDSFEPDKITQLEIKHKSIDEAMMFHTAISEPEQGHWPFDKTVIVGTNIYDQEQYYQSVVIVDKNVEEVDGKISPEKKDSTKIVENLSNEEDVTFVVTRQYSGGGIILSHHFSA